MKTQNTEPQIWEGTAEEFQQTMGFPIPNNEPNSVSQDILEAITKKLSIEVRRMEACDMSSKDIAKYFNNHTINLDGTYVFQANMSKNLNKVQLDIFKRVPSNDGNTYFVLVNNWFKLNK